jgi:hypothetical protein
MNETIDLMTDKEIAEIVNRTDRELPGIIAKLAKFEKDLPGIIAKLDREIEREIKRLFNNPV